MIERRFHSAVLFTGVASGLVPDDHSTHDRRQLAGATPKSNGDLLEPEEEDAEPQHGRLASWAWRMPAACGRTSRGRRAQDQTLRRISCT